MGYSDKKKPLYRKVNTRVPHLGLWHDYGSDAKYDRNTKEGVSKTMKNKKKRGLDFTPLYMFLLSKIGQPWVEVHSEALSRLPEENKDAVNWMFNDISKDDRRFKYFRGGESSYYTPLMVDENGLIQKASDININEIYPSCGCCTHTFNGKPLTNKWKDMPITYYNNGISG
jgi:hypothetical protein